MRNFFWWCAGVNKKLLRGCENEYSKYFAIGATIFFTAVFASFSGGYALYYVFTGSKYAVFLAVSIGILWGAMIFNIDRFLVVSLKKEGKPLKEFGMALPRLLLAIMIGIVIARPLELKLFEKEINDGLANQYKENYYVNERIRIVNEKQNLQIVLGDLNTQYKIKRSDLDKAKEDKEEAEKLRDEETHGVKTGRTTGKVGFGKYAQIKQGELDEKTTLYNKIAQQVDSLEQIITNKQKELIPEKALTNEELNDKADQWATTAGFYDRNKMLSKIANGEYSSFEIYRNAFDNELVDNQQGNSNNVDAFSKEEDGDWTVLFISLLFIIVECLPVFVKLMSKRGNYDTLLEEEEDKVNFIARYENTANKFLVKELSIAQREVLSKAIAKWKEQEMEDEELANHYINRNTENE